MRKRFLCGICFSCLLAGCSSVKPSVDEVKIQFFTDDTSAQMWSDMWPIRDVLLESLQKVGVPVLTVDLDLRNPDTDALYTVFTGYTDLSLMPIELYLSMDHDEGNLIGTCNPSKVVLIGTSMEGKIGVIAGEGKTIDNTYYPRSIGLDVSQAVVYPDLESALEAYQRQEIAILSAAFPAEESLEGFEILNQSSIYPQYVVVSSTARNDLAEYKEALQEALKDMLLSKEGGRLSSYVGIRAETYRDEELSHDVQSWFQTTDN